MRHNFGSDIFFSVGWNSALTACRALHQQAGGYGPAGLQKKRRRRLARLKFLLRSSCKFDEIGKGTIRSIDRQFDVLCRVRCAKEHIVLGMEVDSMPQPGRAERVGGLQIRVIVKPDHRHLCGTGDQELEAMPICRLLEATAEALSHGFNMSERIRLAEYLDRRDRGRHCGSAIPKGARYEDLRSSFEHALVTNHRG